MLSAVSTDIVSTVSMTDVRQEEMVMTLLRHCQSMKRQETRLRLATGFMFIIGFVVIFSLHYYKGNHGEASMGAQSEPLAQTNQETRPPKKPAFHLIAPEKQPNNTNLLQWKNHSNQRKMQYVNISEDGLYHVYLGMSYRIPDKLCQKDTVIPPLKAAVMLSRMSYQGDQKVISSTESITCIFPNYRTVYTGRTINLKAGTVLKVMAYAPYYLIDWQGVFFGVYLT